MFASRVSEEKTDPAEAKNLPKKEALLWIITKETTQCKCLATEQPIRGGITRPHPSIQLTCELFDVLRGKCKADNGLTPRAPNCYTPARSPRFDAWLFTFLSSSL